MYFSAFSLTLALPTDLFSPTTQITIDHNLLHFQWLEQLKVYIVNLRFCTLDLTCNNFAFLKIEKTYNDNFLT